MGLNSQIEWCDASWNPTTGCDKVSQGCKFCYAEPLALRLQAAGVKRYRNGFELTLHPDALTLPLRWKSPKRVFVNSMSDLLHSGVPVSFIQDVVAVMRTAHWHWFQVLTKRADRLAELRDVVAWPANAIVGVSVEDAANKARIDALRRVPASRFLSIEPLLGPLGDLNLEGISWIIVGGESGPHSRPMKEPWVQDILRQCREQTVPFFFKQWGGVHKKAAGRSLNGRTYDELPVLPV